ncbi:hypothetical protein J6590_095925 [Homalodisca vitripennis]|nr:hypothetical protein J6590_095925 [Homalodisca vitripennis]
MQHAHFSEQTSNEETWEYYRQRQPNDKSMYKFVAETNELPSPPPALLKPLPSLPVVEDEEDENYVITDEFLASLGIGIFYVSPYTISIRHSAIKFSFGATILYNLCSSTDLGPQKRISLSKSRCRTQPIHHLTQVISCGDLVHALRIYIQDIVCED